MIKQYVNLPNRARDHHGPRVRLEVQAASLGPNRVGVSEWWVEPVGGDNTDQRYLSRGQRARMETSRVRNQRNTFRNTLLLPHVGGDKHKPRCSKRGDRANAVEMEEFETWRKIYYTVHWMNPQCLATFNAVKGRFEDAFKDGFIELVQRKTLRTRVDETRTRSTNALEHLYRTQPPLPDKPFHLRIVVLNDIYDVSDHSYDEAGVTTKVVTIDTDNPLTDRRREPWLRHAEARINNGRWFNIRGLTRKTGDSEVTVDMTAHHRLSRAIDQGRDVDVRVGTRERDHYLGHSIGNFCCVRINETGTPAQIQTTILQTFTHEVGHGFQQAVRRERTFNAAGNGNGWDNNATWHTNNFGGQGPHCSTNAVLGPDASTTSGQSYRLSAGTLCTMFYRDDPAVDAAGKFCANCLPRLKRVKLGAAQMRLQGWDWY